MMKRPPHSNGYEYVVKGQQAKEIMEEFYKPPTHAEVERVKKAKQKRIKHRTH